MKNRKSIILLLLVAIIGVVGLTVAYFTNTATIENEFQTNSYGTTVEEVFTSPDNWTPGTTTPKTLTVTNSGNLDEAVRVEVMESWMSKNGDPLPLKQNGNDAAIINWANSSDWTKVTENNKTYYYYNYKLAPTEVTSTLLDSVTFNPLITNDSNCTTTESNGERTVTCNSTGDGYDGATYTLTFKVETVQYDKYRDAWGTNIEIALEKPLPSSQYLIVNETNDINKNYNDEGVDKGEMFAITHNNITDYRYIGDEPRNYIYFNCDEPQINQEYDYENSCEVWRIVGVFDVERPNPEDNTQTITEKRIKLLRGNSFTNTMQINSTYINDWTVSTLRDFLNGDYYNRQNDASSYGLKPSARNKIDDAVYYLGAVSYGSNFGTTEKIYGEERGNNVCLSCNSDNTKLTITNKVSLMYPSDAYMVYGKGIDASCYEDPKNCAADNAKKGWICTSNIKQGEQNTTTTWLLTSNAGNAYYGFYMLGGGHIANIGVDRNLAVRPVVYLKANVEFDGGTGASDNPYKIKW